jgi:hypothetical protein
MSRSREKSRKHFIGGAAKSTVHAAPETGAERFLVISTILWGSLGRSILMKKSISFHVDFLAAPHGNSYGGWVGATVPGTARGEDNRRGKKTHKDTTHLLTPRGRRILDGGS